MGQVEVSYIELLAEAVEKISQNRWMSLASSDGSYVTVRKMPYINDGLQIWTITDKKTRKWRQILTNPNIAASIDFIQVEGDANLIPHPKEKANSRFTEAHRKSKTGSDSLENMWLKDVDNIDAGFIQINPRRITLWKKDAPEDEFETVLYLLDVDNKKAYKVTDMGEKASPAYWRTHIISI